MHEIERVLGRAGRRLLLVDLLQTLTVSVTVAAGALIVALLLERVLGIAIPWRGAFIAAGVLAMAGAGVWSLVRRAHGVALAREVDERAGLRDSLSTALCVASADDPWSRAVVETARQRAVRVVVRDAVPIETPRLLPVPAGALLALLVLWFAMPSLDLSGRERALAESRESEQQVVEAKRDVQEMEKELDKLLEKANVDLERPEEASSDPEANADDVRLAAIRKLTSLEDQLKEAREGERSQQTEAMRQMMNRLRAPGPGPLDQMSQALAQGNFGQAKEALEELAKKLESGEMSQADREAAQAQLKNLAEQLQKLGEQQKQLEEALKDAGMTAEQAKNALSDPQAMQQALEQLENLSPEQKQALMEQVQAQQGACKMCQGLGEGLSKMGMAAGQGQLGEMQQGAGQAGMMLSEMEMMEGELAALEASMSSVSQSMGKLAGMCQGNGQGKWGNTSAWQAGESDGLGNGSGGPGRGNGLSPEEQASDYTIEKSKADVKRKNGPITGQRWVYGNQVRGESRQDFAEAARSANASAAEALETMQVESEYREAVKNYFGTLEQDATDEGKDGE